MTLDAGQGRRAMTMRPRVRFVFAWYDLWVGAYWDRERRRLYLLPVPCLGLVLEWPRWEGRPPL